MDFSALNKSAEKSFHQQRALIKKVLAGNKVNCSQCKTPLNVIKISGGLQLVCKNKCTDIKLETE